MLITDADKYNETESRAREAQIPELHNFKQFSETIKAGRERQFKALVKESHGRSVEEDLLDISPSPDKLNSTATKSSLDVLVTQNEEEEKAGAAAAAGKRKRRPTKMNDYQYGTSLTLEQRRRFLLGNKSLCETDPTTQLLIESLLKDE